MASIAWQDGGGRDSALERVPCQLSSSMGWTISLSRGGWRTSPVSADRSVKVVLVPGCGHPMDDKLARHIVDAVVENCRFADNLQAQDGAAGAAGSRSSPAGTIQLGVASRL